MLLQRTGLRYNEKVIAPGAQTERPGGAGPVRASLGGKNLTGHLSLPSPVWCLLTTVSPVERV
jgi:hypothetical protein